MGYSYDTSTALTVNSAVPVIVHLPSTGNATHQVFALDIQREAKYLISAKEAGTDDIDLNIQVYENYEEGSDHTFVQAGFAGESVPPESELYRTKIRTSTVWKLQRGRYFVVVSAIVKGARDGSLIDAAYEIGVACSLDFKLPSVPTSLGVIADPQIPQESCVYVASRRYAPVKLEADKPQYRLTQMKGAHELFGVNVERHVGMLNIRFEARYSVQSSLRTAVADDTSSRVWTGSCSSMDRSTWIAIISLISTRMESRLMETRTQS